MKKVILFVVIFTSFIAQAGGGVQPKPPGQGVHCQMILDEECHFSNAGKVCRPVFREVCLPIVSGS